MAGTIVKLGSPPVANTSVSMESGLDGRNNDEKFFVCVDTLYVSMESGLDGRNNGDCAGYSVGAFRVSMESGLDGRNNAKKRVILDFLRYGLNGVRPRWPEQCTRSSKAEGMETVSMESGLDGRNNPQKRCRPPLHLRSQWSPA